MIRWGRAPLVVLMFAVAACGSAHAPAEPQNPPRSGAAGVPAWAARAPCPTPARHPPFAPLPPGFTPIAAVQCTYHSRTIPGRGLWEVQVKQVASHGLGPLMAALRRPSQVRPPNIICPAIAIIPPWFVLVGHDGQVIRPRVPTDECGLPQRQVFTALRKLPWVTVSSRLSRQLETQAELVTGCAPVWKNMIYELGRAAGHGFLRPSAGGPVFKSRPASILVCVYRIGPVPGATRFVHGGRVSGAAETALLGGIAAGRDSVACSLPTTLFAVLQAAVYVEIDGCHRVLRPGNGIGQASPAALAIINHLRQG